MNKKYMDIVKKLGLICIVASAIFILSTLAYAATTTTAIKTVKAYTSSAIVKGRAVNLRKGSSKTTKIIGLLHRGDKVSVISKQNGWDDVKTSKGAIGWVFDTLLTVK